MRLIHGNCFEEIDNFEDESFDALVTDPPFGIGFGKYKNSDVAKDFNEYQVWIRKFIKRVLPKVKSGGLICIWQANLYNKYFNDIFGDYDYRVFAACKNFVQIRKIPINYGYDPVILWYKDGNNPLRPEKPKRNLDFFISNTAALVSKPDRIERGHPCPRPLDVVQYIIENFTVGHVFDPFMGSGTTGVACKNLDRDFTGIELEKEYFEIAEKRILSSNT